MEYLVQSVAIFLDLLISAHQIALLIRIVSEFFIPDADQSTLYRVAYVLTEPVLAFCSALLELVGIKNNGPIDLTIYVSLILTMVLRLTLSPLI